MEGVPEADRTARFHSSVVFVGRDDDGEEVLCGDGDCEGRIGFERRGESGFGYDPLFLPDDTPGRTMKLQARGLVPLAFSFVRYLCAEPNGRSLATIGCACPLRLRARRDWSCVLETVVRLDRGSYR